MTERWPAPDAASGVARTWYPYSEADGTDVVTPELVAATRTPDEELTRLELRHRVLEMQSVLSRAAQGTLRDEAWKPVAREPDLWELRWSWGRRLQARGYFYEPPLEPDSSILAKVHRKVIVEDDPRATTAAQNSEINEAGNRIRRGQSHRWGLGASTPIARAQPI